ncbi:MAG: hypothetical protein KAX31_05980, partial [Thermoplasmata archaeon]|nr:hypothetical protein [Thermoplasmata archaeon]
NIKNIGKNIDSFDLSLDSGVWGVTFYDTAWTPIVNTGMLNPTESIDIYINVTIPGAALEGDIDTSVVKVSSTVDNTVYEFANLITQVPYIPQWNDDMEGSVAAWSYTGSGTGIGASEWFLTGNNPNSPVNSWYYGQDAIWEYDPGPNDGKLMTPWVDLPAGCILAEMNVWHDYDFENYWDGGVVDITTDGEIWSRLTPVRGYDGTLGHGLGNVLEGQEAFTGTSWYYINDVFDISPYIGNVVKLRFWAGVDSWDDIGDEGWYIDDITIICPQYGCIWDPAAQSSFDTQGEVKTYSMDLRNIGRFQDTFTFTTTTTLGWPVDVYDNAWNPAVDSGAIDPGFFRTFHANVTIPLAALSTDMETTVITATSTLDASYWADETLSTFVIDPVLLVTDDWENTVELGWFDALDNNSFGGFYSYDWLDTYTMGIPSLEGLQAHQIVIWVTQGVGTHKYVGHWGWDPRECLDPAERAVIDQYLDGGGLMYLSSAFPMSARINGYVPWGSQYFGMTSTHAWPVGIDMPYEGVDGNVIGDGISGMYGPSWGYCNGEGASCAGGADGDFEVAFVYPTNGFCVGTTLDNGITRRVATTFDPTNVDYYAMRDLILRRILTFLLPPPYDIMRPGYQSSYAFAGDTAAYDLNITNTGTLPDIYDITVTSVPLGWTVSLYEADGVTPLADTGGIPGVPDTGTVDPGGYYYIVVKVQVDALANPGDFDVATIRAESFNAPPINGTADLETKVPYYILLVDDDDSTNNAGPYDTYAVEDTGEVVGTPYADALTALGYQFDLYVVPSVVPSGADGPDLETLLHHPIVIWLCGYEWGWAAPSLTSTDQNNLATYLDNGGKLWQNLESLEWYLSTSPGSFAYDYLKISNAYFGADELPPNPVVGEPGTIFAGASYATASVWPFGKSCTGEVDILALPNSLGVFPSPTGYCANTYEDGYQTCYFGFEFAFITNAADREDCAWRILNWFTPPVGVSIGPSPQNWYGTPTSYVWYNLTVKNNGFGGADGFDMSYVSPLGWTYDFFESDMATPLVDTNGNLVPDTGDIPKMATKDISVRVTVPGTAMEGDIDVGTVTATSFNDALISADAALETLCYVPGQGYRAVYISNHPESDAAAAENDQLLYNSAIWAGNTGGNVKLTIVDSWGTKNPAAWQSWAAGHGDIDVVFVDSDAFTYGDLIMSQGDVLVISHAKGRVYSDTEISAIQQYTNESHGLIATGGSMDFGVPNNIKLLPLFGLAIGFQPWATSFTEYMVDEPLHPVMAGLPNPFSPGTALESCTMMTLGRAVCLAHLDTDLTGMITAYDTTPPTFAGIQTCVDTEGAINLGWLPATSSTAITYNIYQALASGAQNFAAPTYTTTELNYQVTGLVKDVTYYYVVRAKDKYGNEDTNTVELSAT